MSERKMDDVKKGLLLELFKEAVIGQLCMGPTYTQRALDEAKEQGVTDDDLQWLAEVTSDSERFFKAFGEDSLSKEFQALLKVSDNMTTGFGYSPQYQGLYPKLSK